MNILKQIFGFSISGILTTSLRQELGNLIESGQDGRITKTDLDAATKEVKDDQKDVINKRTDYVKNL